MILNLKTYTKNANFDDLTSINELLRLSKAYWGYDSEFLDRFIKTFCVTHEYIEKNTIKLFYVEEKLAGFFNFCINKENIFELDNFFLHPDYIGKGFGQKLWNICCQLAHKQRIAEFIIWSEPKAEKFYLKMGCEKISVRQSLIIPNLFAPILKFKAIL